MTHEFDIKQYRKYESSLRGIPVILGTLNGLLALGLYYPFADVWELIFTISWPFAIGIFIISYFIDRHIGKRSMIIEDGTHVVYRRYKLIHGKNQIQYIEYHIVNVLDIRQYWIESLRVVGEIEAVYVRKNGEIYRVKTRGKVDFPPYFEDADGLLGRLRARAEENAEKAQEEAHDT